MPDEIWKDIIGHEGRYQISNLGNVKSLPKSWYTGIANITMREIILKHNICKGYPEVQLMKDNNRVHFKIHVLIGNHFIEKIENKNYLNHKNGNKLDYSIQNLEWCTLKENSIHAFETGLNNNHGENNNFATLTLQDVTNIIKMKGCGSSQKAIAKLFNINQSTVCRLWSGKRWKYSLNKIQKRA